MVNNQKIVFNKWIYIFLIFLFWNALLNLLVQQKHKSVAKISVKEVQIIITLTQIFNHDQNQKNQTQE